MSTLQVKDLGVSGNQQGGTTGLLKTRGSWSEWYCGWKNTQENHSHHKVHLLIKKGPQKRGLEGYRLGFSYQPTPQRPITMEYEKKMCNIASHWEELGASCWKICFEEIL
ncbi:hypothetical protein O181_055841 [Austropuccinia psidii MF-1]|uniref:Uncharacterized protein n=1 Tax=Austropuccinia psidii MF-1 TaxID=1389203 RepID=A0A9Q3EC59_9BASI|nr:hypothetical protein [Austropuccinia psidii MF-1]